MKKPPPRVIPYHKHQEGKKRLAEVLLQQSQRTSSASLDHGNRWRMLTPPDTPHSLPLPDDHMEKASLDSRGSTEEASASVSSGEVATGTLIDLAGMTPHVLYCSIDIHVCIMLNSNILVYLNMYIVHAHVHVYVYRSVELLIWFCYTCMCILFECSYLNYENKCRQVTVYVFSCLQVQCIYMT